MLHLKRRLIFIAVTLALICVGTPLFSQPVQEEYDGHFDSCSEKEVTGWALHNKKGASILVVVNGKTIADNVRPNVQRPDLALAKGGAPDSGFHFKFPAPLKAGDTVQIKFAEVDKVISGLQGLASCTPIPNFFSSTLLFVWFVSSAFIVIVLAVITGIFDRNRSRLVLNTGDVWPLAIAMVCLALLALWLRRPSQFSDPYIWVEDGTYNLKAFAERGWWSILEPVSGYHIVATKLIVLTAFNVSILHAPTVALIGTVTATALVVLSIVFCPTALRWRPLCAAYVLLLPTDAEVFGVSEYAFWWAGLLLLLALVWENSARHLVGRIFCVVIGGLSSPIILPLSMLFLLRAAILRTWTEVVITTVAVDVAAIQLATLIDFDSLPGTSLWKLPVLKIIGKFSGYFVAPTVASDSIAITIGLISASIAVCLVAWHRLRLPMQFWLLCGALASIMGSMILRIPIDDIHPLLAGPRYFFYVFILMGWIAIWVASIAHRVVGVGLVSLLVISIAQTLPKMRRLHDPLDWPSQIQMCAASGRYQLPIHYAGSSKELWHVELTGEQCKRLIRQSWF